MLIPLVGVAAYTTAVVRTKVAESASAARAESAVAAVASLGAARSGVEHEAIPVLDLAVIDDPAGAEALGIPAFLLQAQRAVAEESLRDSRATTDAALGDVPAGSVGAAAAARARMALTSLRDGAAAHERTLLDLYTGYLAISDRLADAQRRAAASAGTEDVPVGTLGAMRDVQLAAQLAQRASRLIPLSVGAEVTGSTLDGGLPPWQDAWNDYLDARRRTDELSQPTVRAAWARAQDAPAVTGVDTLLAAQAEPSAAPLPALRIITLVNQSSDRDGELTGLLETWVDQARALAAEDRKQADVRRDRALAAGIGVLLASLLFAVLLGRRVSRSLGALAGQADRVSEGSLVEVAVSGPREVRRVSAALASAVANLGRIQRQAEAVATGDLGAAVLDEPLPGPLGEVVHASVVQLVQSVRQREELRSALAHQATTVR